MLIAQNLFIGNPSLLIENLSFSLDSKRGLKIGLVGPNGSGKSSFLKTLVGLEQAISGTLAIANEKIAYLSQHPAFPKEKMVGEILEEELQEHFEFYRIEIFLDEFGLSHEILLRLPETLSGGEQLKIKLIQLLLGEPTILLLDEPTNHLDTAGIHWLTGFLKKFPGSLILVSHHRGVLNSSVSRIWEIEPSKKTIVDYPGNYDFWVKERQRTRAQKEERFYQLDRQIKGISNWLKANEFHPKYRFSSFVMQQKKKLDSLEDERELFRLSEESEIRLKAQLSSSKKPSRLLTYDFEKAGIFTRKKGSIYRGDHVQLIGPNGSGKTSFLRILAGEDQDFQGSLSTSNDFKMAWLKQHCALLPSQKVEEALYAQTALNSTDFWKLLANFRLKEHRKRCIKDLSGGEQKRLELAIIMISQPDILLLDEPTNHLDLYLQEEIQNFLVSSELTLVFVTHDPILEKALDAKEKIFF